MQIFKNENYVINKGVYINNNFIFDNRLVERLRIDETLDCKIIQDIFNVNNTSDVLKKTKAKNNEVKRHFQYLYNLDIISFKRQFTKKTIYSNNLFCVLINIILSYFLRILPFFILNFFIAIILNINIFLSLYIFIYFFTSIIVHEIGHLIVFYFLNNFKMQCFVVIEKFQIKLITCELSDFYRKIVALTGPLVAIIYLIIIIIITNQKILLLGVMLNFFMLLPFFDDGKHLWAKKR